MVVTVTPLAVGTIVARLVFQMSPMMVLGGLAGAQTCTPGPERAARSERGARRELAYTVPYAIGKQSCSRTCWGPVVGRHRARDHALRGSIIRLSQPQGASHSRWGSVVQLKRIASTRNSVGDRDAIHAAHR